MDISKVFYGISHRLSSYTFILFVKSTILTLNSKSREFNIGSRRRLAIVKGMAKYFKSVIPFVMLAKIAVAQIQSRL